MIVEQEREFRVALAYLALLYAILGLRAMSTKNHDGDERLDWIQNDPDDDWEPEDRGLRAESTTENGLCVIWNDRDGKPVEEWVTSTVYVTPSMLQDDSHDYRGYVVTGSSRAPDDDGGHERGQDGGPDGLGGGGG